MPDGGNPGRHSRSNPLYSTRNRWILAGAAATAVVLAAGAAVAITNSSGRTEWQAVPDQNSPSGSPSPSPTPSPTGPAVSFAAVGDVIMGSTPVLPPNGGRTFFDDVTPHLRGDVVMANWESAVTDDATSTKCKPKPPASPTASATPPGTPGPIPPSPSPSPSKPDRCFAFRVPTSYAALVRKAGFNVVNLANNHTRDYGTKGLRDTKTALTAAGVQHTGTAGQITMMQAGAAKVAVLGFSPYSWTNSVVDVPAAAELVRKAAAQADLVVVNMHAGAEGADQTHVRPGTEMFLGENRGDPIRFARAVVDAGADLVVGHSPHVMRGMEWYRDRLIAYSMGNFAGYRVLSSAGPLGVGGILKVTLRPDGSWIGGTLVPTRMVNGGLPAVDPTKRALSLVRDVSAADFGATACEISDTGELRPPAGS